MDQHLVALHFVLLPTIGKVAGIVSCVHLFDAFIIILGHYANMGRSLTFPMESTPSTFARAT